jgi:hypothetical protein
MIKIALQKTDFSSRESLAMTDICVRKNIPFRVVEYGSDVSPNDTPVGSVEFVESAIGKSFKPEYHPVWLKEFVKRKTWTSEFWPEEDCYVKPNDLYKIFANTYSFDAPFNKDFSKEYFCQEAVEVRNEWRIYVSNGKVWNCSWYQGPDEDKEFDQNILKNIVDKIPKGWYGTIDMMETENGIQLCECHHPYAIGWYGDSCENGKYFDFIVNGYKYLKNCENTGI